MLELARLADAAYRSRFSRVLVEWLFSIVHRHPTLILIARRASRLLPSGMAVQLHRYHYKWKISSSLPFSASSVKRRNRGNAWRKEKPIDLELLRPYAMRGQLTTGWYGGRDLRPEETALAHVRPPTYILRLGESAYEVGSRVITARYLSDGGPGSSVSHSLRHAPIDEFRAFLDERRPPDSVAKIPGSSGFTIVTPFHKHLDLFTKTAVSVDRLFQGKETATLEWVIVNDDPEISDDALAQRIPERLMPAVRQFRSDDDGGIVNTLNTGIRNSRNRWILFLDCDDEIEISTITILNHYFKLFPRCRYISSSMIDIDEQGEVLRFRGNEHPLNHLFETGMLAGHLKAIRRDLFEEIGYLDARFELCQDYEFALRTAMREPILKIPEPLYRYRWHGNSQSVLQSDRQAVIHRRIQHECLRRFLDIRERAKVPAKDLRSPPSRPHTTALRGAAIVRTRNKRPELLSEAVASVHAQVPNMVPIVVVHGEERDFQNVKAQSSSDDRTIFLHASEERKPGRRLGYPGNVALNYVTNQSERFDYVTFLDDDDILYPFFAARMSEALTWSGADLVYAISNKRWPWRSTQIGPLPFPASCLIAENFITCNSYTLVTEFLRRTDVRFDEHKRYLDDWEFLLSLWSNGARFHFFSETLSEFRITNDGNTITKKYPKEYAVAAADVQMLSEKITIAERAGLSRFWRDMIDFGWSDVPIENSDLRVVDLAYSCWLRGERYRESATLAAE